MATMTDGKNGNNNNGTVPPLECVGSLLVPACTLQELSNSGSTSPTPSTNTITVTPTAAAVGTLLLDPANLETFPQDSDVKLVRRLTKAVQEMPIPGDEDIGNWPD